MRIALLYKGILIIIIIIEQFLIFIYIIKK
jgi:hypothetical protein